MRDKMSKMLRWWVVALILMAATGFLAIMGAAKAEKPDLTTRQEADSNSATQQPAPASGNLRSQLSKSLAFRVMGILPEDGVISAFEPIIIEAEITNISSDLVTLDYCGDLCIRLEVRDAHGKLVGDTPVYSYADVRYGIHRLVPRQSMRTSFIPSAVYQFRNSGDYSIRIMFLELPKKITEIPSDLGPIIGEATVSVKMLPFDENRIKKRCDELIERYKTMMSSSQSDFSPFENMLALCSIRHNAALPALKIAAEDWYDWPAARAIRRIGTSESAALLKELAARKDAIGRSARSAEQADVRIQSDDYFTGWTNVTSPEATVNEFLYYYRHGQWDQAKARCDDFFLRKQADQLKDGGLFAKTAGKSVQSILNDAKSKPLRSRKEGRFVIVDVGQESSSSFGQVGIAHFQLIGRGSNEWLITDFPR